MKKLIIFLTVLLSMIEISCQYIPFRKPIQIVYAGDTAIMSFSEDTFYIYSNLPYIKFNDMLLGEGNGGITKSDAIDTVKSHRFSHILMGDNDSIRCSGTFYEFNLNGFYDAYIGLTADNWVYYDADILWLSHMSTAPSTPSESQIYYNSTDKKFYGRTNLKWVDFMGGSATNHWNKVYIDTLIMDAIDNDSYIAYTADDNIKTYLGGNLRDWMSTSDRFLYSNLYPGTNNYYSLGDATHYWLNSYQRQVYIDTLQLKSYSAAPLGVNGRIYYDSDDNKFYGYNGSWVDLTGAGTPGGSPNALQYNNAGSFGGFGEWNGTNIKIGTDTVSQRLWSRTTFIEDGGGGGADRIAVWKNDKEVRAEANLRWDDTYYELEIDGLIDFGGYLKSNVTEASNVPYFRFYTKNTAAETDTILEIRNNTKPLLRMYDDSLSYYGDLHVYGSIKAEGSGSFNKTPSFVFCTDSVPETPNPDTVRALVFTAAANGLELVDMQVSSENNGDRVISVHVIRMRAGVKVNMTSTPATLGTEYTVSDEVINTSYDDIQAGDIIMLEVTKSAGTTRHKGIYIGLTFQ